ncbi:MAG: hypothetical protein KBB32_09480 [Spirochaetia bacterium]|nr:hypothetical protein [Spirochaetia bacterium]
MKRKGTGLIRTALALAALAALLWLAAGAILAVQRARIGELERQIASLTAETVPIRFMVESRSDDRLTVSFAFLNLAGTEYARTTATVRGTSLFVDLLVVPYGDAWLAFPYRAFGELEAPADGVEFGGLVMKDGLPRSHEGGPFDHGSLAELGRLYAAYLAGAQPAGAFGSAVHDVASLGRFKLGVPYRVVARKAGGIEILED